jgi:Uma2 family endonuclease
MLLQRNGVPYYWVISPEDKVLIAYRLVEAKYHVVFALELRVEAVADEVRIPPFEDIDMDLRYVFGDEN